MRCNIHTFLPISILFFLLIVLTNSATVKDVFNLTPQSPRIPRDNKYYPSRYNPQTSLSSINRVIKPEDSPEAHEATQNPVEKRCSRCDTSYSDTRYPYETRARYEDRRYRPYENDDRRYDRYDRYDDRRYDDRYDRERYDRYDRRPSYDRYDRDRYDRNDRERYDGRDRYDRDRYSDRDYDRGFGYDNRGYDYRDRGYSDFGGSSGQGYDGGRGYYSGGRPDGGSGYWGTGGYASNWNYGGGRDEGRDRDPDRYNDGFKPWDETYRGSSGWDSSGRGYYFATGIPEVGAEHWGSKGYVERDNNEADRYGGGGAGAGSGRGGGGGGGASGGGYYRPRDPYDGYRSTSYLYARPSSTTTNRPPNSGDDSGATQSPQQDNTSG